MLIVLILRLILRIRTGQNAVRPDFPEQVATVVNQALDTHPMPTNRIKHLSIQRFANPVRIGVILGVDIRDHARLR